MKMLAWLVLSLLCAAPQARAVPQSQVLYPDADVLIGDLGTWTGCRYPGFYECIDEPNTNDELYVKSQYNNTTSTYTFSYMAPSPALPSIDKITFHIYTRKHPSAPGSSCYKFQVHGSDDSGNPYWYTHCTNVASPSWDHAVVDFFTDPTTGQAWVPSLFNGGTYWSTVSGASSGGNPAGFLLGRVDIVVLY